MHGNSNSIPDKELNIVLQELQGHTAAQIGGRLFAFTYPQLWSVSVYRFSCLKAFFQN